MPQDTSRAEIKAAYNVIQTRLRDGTGSPENRQDAQNRLEAIEGELSYLIGDRGFEEFVEERLEHYRSETDASMCSCWRATCSLRRGEVPPKLRQHGTELTGRRPPEELLIEYLNHHDGGEALKLIRQEWSQMAVRVDLELGAIRSVLKGASEESNAIKQNLGVDGEDTDADAETAGAD